jgi:TatD DNase family protein
MLFETHCHLTDRRFDADRAETIERARATGVGALVSIASSVADAEEVAALTRAHRGVWGTAGIHPHQAGQAHPDDVHRVRELLEGEPHLVAVGETGLDYHYDFCPRDRQRELFRGHARLAAETGRPLVVHSRSADDDTRAAIAEFRGAARGVLHCFTGGMELLEEALDAGWHISFTGLVTFKNFRGQEALRAVPRDRLMIETDSPYLAPVPHRGKRNEPAYVARVRDGVAAVRGESPEEVERYTTRNAFRFFGLQAEEAGLPAAPSRYAS